MEFNNVALTNDALIQNCESLSKLGNGGISGNTVLLAKFTGWINQAWEKVAMAILTVDKNWRWDDNHYGSSFEANTAYPIATTNLVDGQRDYILPRATNSSDQSTLWKVYKVRLKDSNGKWFTISPLSADEDEIAQEGKPTKYRLISNSIRLSGPPDSDALTLTAGIQVWFQRAFVKFTVADTIRQPGFMSSYHHLLCLDASATHLLPTSTELSAGYLALFKSGLEDMKVSFAQRNDDPQTTKRIVPHLESTR